MEADNSKGKKQFRYIIVPLFIIEDTSLLDGEKLLFGEIASNTLQKGYCWFSNQHIATLFHVGVRTASRWIHKLEKKSYIKIEMKYRAGTKEIEERKIEINTSIPILAEYMQWYSQPCRECIDTNVHTPIDTDVRVNNTEVNNIVNSDVPNIELNSTEYQILIDDFGVKRIEAVLVSYSNWKQKMDAHPKSDFETLRKWLNKTQRQNNRRISSVKASKADEVTDEMLKDLPF